MLAGPRVVEKSGKNLNFVRFLTTKPFLKTLKSPNFRFCLGLKKNFKNPDFRRTVTAENCCLPV